MFRLNNILSRRVEPVLGRNQLQLKAQHELKYL